MYKFYVYLIATIHFVILTLVILSLALSAIYQPWYITYLLIMACFRFLLTRESCPITIWEDNMREKAHMPSTRGKFIKYYYNLIFKR